MQPLGLESPALSVSYFGRASFEPESLKDLDPVYRQTVSINLSNMPLEDADLEPISPFSNLEKLYLNFASIKGDGIQYLQNLENLSLLSLSGNPLDETAVPHLSAMTQLKKLYVWNTNLSGESLEELRAALPGTTIESGTQVSGEVLMLNPPVIRFDKAFFQDKLTAEITHPIGTTSIFYTLDGTEPDSSNHEIYEKPLEINENTTLKARAFADGWIGSEKAEAEFIKATLRPSDFQMNHLPEDRYKGDGQESLFDRKKAIPDVWNLNWLGFLNNPLEVEMEFEQPTDISKLALSLWQNPGARFFPPAEVKLWSRENKDQEWKLIHTFRPPSLQKDAPTLLKQMDIPFSARQVKQLKLLARPIEKLPSWHGAAGNKAWLMVDEVVMN